MFDPAERDRLRDTLIHHAHADPHITAAAAPDPAQLIGMGWLYALHARSSIARGRTWQAEYMISGMRDHVLALACRRPSPDRSPRRS